MAQTYAGIVKVLARKARVSVEEYQSRRSRGEKWCYGCQQWLNETEFSIDRTRYDGRMPLCRVCRSTRDRARYVPVPNELRKPMGPSAQQPRTGDKKQARQRINVEVRTGRRPRPNTLRCVDCGHEWKPGERRHEYDHHLGYDSEHHYDVEPVCTTCHRRRVEERGECVQVRDYHGRYAPKRKEDRHG